MEDNWKSLVTTFGTLLKLLFQMSQSQRQREPVIDSLDDQFLSPALQSTRNGEHGKQVPLAPPRRRLFRDAENRQQQV